MQDCVIVWYLLRSRSNGKLNKYMDGITTLCHLPIFFHVCGIARERCRHTRHLKRMAIWLAVVNPNHQKSHACLFVPAEPYRLTTHGSLLLLSTRDQKEYLCRSLLSITSIIKEEKYISDTIEMLEVASRIGTDLFDMGKLTSVETEAFIFMI